MNIKNKINSAVQKLIDKLNGSGVMQDENTVNGKKFVFPDMPEAALKAAEEGTVLLKNNGALPLKKDESIAVFGRCQIDYFYVGYGSGGDVNQPYAVNLIDGLKNNGVKLNEKLLGVYSSWCKNNPVNHGFWGHWPMNYPEMELTDSLVTDAAKASDTAIIILGRAAGEDRENKLDKGSYYLTDTEMKMLDLVTCAFNKIIVVMNCGNIIDMEWVKKYGDKINAIVYAWQCGMESGNALANILTGKTNPSGKLTDTIAVSYKDYPSSKDFGNADFNNYTEDIFVGYRYFETFDKSKVLFPFGFGLSYTDFEITPDRFIYDDKIKITVTVKNSGNTAGKEVLQVYVCCPDGRLKKAEKSLVAFAKTRCLAPNECESINFEIEPYDFASYDEDISSYITEKGEYAFYIGNNVNTDLLAGTVDLDEQVLERLLPVCPVQNPFKIITGETLKMVKRF